MAKVFVKHMAVFEIADVCAIEGEPVSIEDLLIVAEIKYTKDAVEKLVEDYSALWAAGHVVEVAPEIVFGLKALDEAVSGVAQKNDANKATALQVPPSVSGFSSRFQRKRFALVLPETLGDSPPN